jgi:hypothetical protein
VIRDYVGVCDVIRSIYAKSACSLTLSSASSRCVELGGVPVGRTNIAVTRIFLIGFKPATSPLALMLKAGVPYNALPVVPALKASKVVRPYQVLLAVSVLGISPEQHHDTCQPKD